MHICIYKYAHIHLHAYILYIVFIHTHKHTQILTHTHKYLVKSIVILKMVGMMASLLEVKNQGRNIDHLLGGIVFVTNYKSCKF